jgi:hypothetical protein
MSREFVILFSIVLFYSCGPRNNEYKINDDHLNKAIEDRATLLGKDSLFASELPLLTKNVNNLLYLTVDIENINASIVKTNQYFTEAPLKYKVDTAGFVKVYKGLPLSEIIATIKRNHLNLLNKILLLRNKDGALMYTAQ